MLVQRYGGAILVVQTIVWCGVGVVYGVYLAKVGFIYQYPFTTP